MNNPNTTVTVAQPHKLPTIERIDQVPQAVATSHIVIVGNSGSGKTYIAKGFTEWMLKQNRRVCILDPTGVWWGLRYRADGSSGFPLALIGGQFGDVPLDPTAGEAYGEIIGARDMPTIIDMSEMTMGEKHEFATHFFLSVYRHNRRPLQLIVDEADEFAPQNPLPETRRMLGAFDRIIRRGRTRGFRSIMITQRPAVLHKNVLSQATTLISTRLIGSQDRQAVELWIKGQADMAQAKILLSSLASLKTGDGWIWAPSLNQPLQRLRWPGIITMDSSRTPEDDEPALTPPEGVKTAVFVQEYAELFHVEQSADDGEPVSRGSHRAAPAAAIADKAAETRAYAAGSRDARAAAATHTRQLLDQLRASAQAFVATIDEAAAAPAEIDIDPKPVSQQAAAEPKLVNKAAARAILDQLRQPYNFAHAPYRKKCPIKIGAADVARGAAVKRVANALENNPAAAKLIAAAAQYPNEPISWQNIGLLAGVSLGNGHFYGGKKYLVAQGFIEEFEDGNTMITRAGLKAAGGEQPKATLRDVVQVWAPRLRPPGADMLEAIINAKKVAVSAAELSLAIGKKPGNGHWYGGVKALRRAGFIEQESSTFRLTEFARSLA